MKFRQQAPVECWLHVVFDVVTDVETKTSESKAQIVSRRIVRSGEFAIPVMVVVCVRHSDISQQPGETKPKSVPDRIHDQQPQRNSDANRERSQKAGEHSGSGAAQNFNPAMQPGQRRVGHAIVNSVHRLSRIVRVFKSKRAGPIAVRPSVLLRKSMMIVDVMHLVAFHRDAVRNEKHPIEHLVQQVLAEDLQMRVIMLNQVQPSDWDGQDNN
jgi:hypothetical protein